MKQYELIASGTSAASSITTVPLQLDDLTGYSFTVAFTGSNVTGSLILEASNDGTTYVQITGSSLAVTNSQKQMYNAQGAMYRYVRVVWTYTSGTGNIHCVGTIKEPAARRGA